LTIWKIHGSEEEHSKISAYTAIPMMKKIRVGNSIGMEEVGVVTVEHALEREEQ
jgi:hypothetical protein